MVEATATGRLVHPMRGSKATAERSSIDELMQLLTLIKDEIRQLRSFEYDVRDALNEHVNSDKKTSRLATSDGRTVKVERPSASWAQGALRELWFSEKADAVIPVLNCVKIASFGVYLRELAKVREMSGDQRFEEAKQLLLGAEKPPTSPPTFTIEEK